MPASLLYTKPHKAPQLKNGVSILMPKGQHIITKGSTMDHLFCVMIKYVQINVIFFVLAL